MEDQNQFDIIGLISANTEWTAIRKIVTPLRMFPTPYGEGFTTLINKELVAFIQGGWGKISAAASTQYAIDSWRPKLLINLGTCGGFEGMVKKFEILLVEETVVYDIIEQMSDPVEALQTYSTSIDLSWLLNFPPVPFRRARLVSADRDICPTDIPFLVRQYQAIAADWESGAIAWVSKRNKIPCLILRGVSDLVREQGGEAYGNMHHFIESTHQVMNILLNQLPLWVTAIKANDNLGWKFDD